MQNDGGQTALQKAFGAALGFRQAGNLIEAEKHCREVLPPAPRQSTKETGRWMVARPERPQSRATLFFLRLDNRSIPIFTDNRVHVFR